MRPSRVAHSNVRPKGSASAVSMIFAHHSGFPSVPASAAPRPATVAIRKVWRLASVGLTSRAGSTALALPVTTARSVFTMTRRASFVCHLACAPSSGSWVRRLPAATQTRARSRMHLWRYRCPAQNRTTPSAAGLVSRAPSNSRALADPRPSRSGSASKLLAASINAARPTHRRVRPRATSAPCFVWTRPTSRSRTGLGCACRATSARPRAPLASSIVCNHVHAAMSRRSMSRTRTFLRRIAQLSSGRCFESILPLRGARSKNALTAARSEVGGPSGSSR